MFQRQTLHKFLDIITIFAVFFTPLLFFTESHDQFELPKLTLLMFLIVPFLIFELKEKRTQNKTFLTLSLGLFLGALILSSLPSTSLSWRVSFLGDYENFSGLTSVLTYLLWFRFLSRFINESKIEKLFYFISLAAFLSALYAISQHFKFDFVQWNPESVNATREFAALGNPNFLSAFLAMSIPLYLCISLRLMISDSDAPNPLKPVFWILGLAGLLLILLGTGRGQYLLHLPLSSFFNSICRSFGLLFLAFACVRLSLSRSWLMPLLGLTVLIFGLFSTGSRGGFSGALFGLIVWALLALRQPKLSLLIRQKFASVSMIHAGLFFIVISTLLFSFGGSFLHRLADSVLHLGQSLATSRLHIWRPAVSIAMANPLTGVGLDTFKIAFPYYSGIEFNQIDGMFMSSRMAHNQLLQMAATTGFMGLAAYLSVLGTFGFLWRKAFRTAQPAGQWILIAVLASAIAYHVQNFFSFGVATIDFLWFFFLAIVQNFYQKYSPASPNSPLRPLHSFSILLKRVVVLSLIVFLLVFPLRRLSADIAYCHGNAISEYLKNPNPKTASSDLFYYSDAEIHYSKKAVELFPLEVKYQLYLGLAYEQRAHLEADQSRDWYLEALHCYQKSAEMSPANAYYYNDQGRVLTALSRFDPHYLSNAVETYGKSVKWAPASPAFLINWSDVLSKLGRKKEAQLELNKAFRLDSAFSAKVLAQMALDRYRSGDKKEAFQYLDEAAGEDTSCAEVFYCRGILFLSEKEKRKALAEFEKTQDLHPTAEKNPSIQYLDRFTEQAKN